MAEPQDEQGSSVDAQKQYLIEKFGALIKQIGDGYGGPLQEELIRRLEKTIAEFHEEVTELIETMRTRSQQRYERLKTLWSEGKLEITPETGGAVAETVEPEPEISEWERKLEERRKQREQSKPETKTEPQKKKKSLFGRQKK
jgi:hypothetical protein